MVSRVKIILSTEKKISYQKVGLARHKIIYDVLQNRAHVDKPTILS